MKQLDHSAALPLRAHVNLIPLNPTPGYAGRGTPAAGAAWFGAELAARGVKATVRANRGTDIDAACGQLAGKVTDRTLVRLGTRLNTVSRSSAEV